MKNKTQTTLLPCPFCSSDAQIIECKVTNPGLERSAVFAQCEYCNAQSDTVCIDIKVSEEDAIRTVSHKWNTRSYK